MLPPPKYLIKTNEMYEIKNEQGGRIKKRIIPLFSKLLLCKNNVWVISYTQCKL